MKSKREYGVQTLNVHYLNIYSCRCQAMILGDIKFSKSVAAFNVERHAKL